MSGLHWTWQEPGFLLGGVCLLIILAYSLQAAYRRLWYRSRLRWLMVALLSTLSALALSALLNPPEWKRQADARVVLVTEGDTGPEPGGQVYLTGRQHRDSPGSDLLLHGAQLPLRRPGLGHLDLRGHGLEPAELAAFDRDLDVRFSPPEVQGLVDVAWPRAATAGTPVSITGEYVSPTEGTVELSLLDPSGKRIDSSKLNPDDTFSFLLRPLAAGPLDYTLSLSRAGQLIAEEPVSIDVTEGSPVDLFVLQSAPSFDARQLRRWAGDQGSRIRIRSRISRSHWITQGVNVPKDELDTQLQPAFLSELDLLVVDGRSWTELGPQERAVVTAAIEDGLGILIWVDQSLAEAGPADRGRLLDGFELEAASADKAQDIPIIPGLKDELELPLAGWKIKAAQGNTLLTGASGRALEIWRDYGVGRVALSRLRERHRWLTSGQDALFSAYWNNVLRTVARPRKAPFLLPMDDTNMTWPGERAPLCALAGERPLNISVESPSGAILSVPATAPASGGAKICGFFWPDQAGWHRVELHDAASGIVLDRQYIRVLSFAEWQAERALSRERATNRWFHALTGTTAKLAQSGETRQVSEPIGPTWPWLLFLLSSSLLWIERRRD